MPIETQLRLWDLLFIHGPVVLLCGITALFQKAEPLLLELSDVVEMKNCLQDTLKSSRDAEDFVTHTLTISAATADLDIRKEWQTHIQTSFAKTVDAQGMEKLQAPPLPPKFSLLPLEDLETEEYPDSVRI